MAKKDVALYFLQVQSQYTEMLENVKDLQEALAHKRIEQEQVDTLQKEISVVKNNYERLAYIMMLLNKPQRKSKQSKEENVNKQWYDYLSGSSKEAIFDENADMLSDFKKLIKEIKDDNR